MNIAPPMRSVIRWKEVIETATECQLLAKTTASGLAALVARIEALHPYETPEIVVLAAADASAAYAAWVAEQTGPIDQSSAASQSAASSAK